VRDSEWRLENAGRCDSHILRTDHIICMLISRSYITVSLHSYVIRIPIIPICLYRSNRRGLDVHLMVTSLIGGGLMSNLHMANIEL